MEFSPVNPIPPDASALEVFHLTETEAYLGYHTPSGFHFVQVPLTVPKPILLNLLVQQFKIKDPTDGQGIIYKHGD